MGLEREGDRRWKSERDVAAKRRGRSDKEKPTLRERERGSGAHGPRETIGPEGPFNGGGWKARIREKEKKRGEKERRGSCALAEESIG